MDDGSDAVRNRARKPKPKGRDNSKPPLHSDQLILVQEYLKDRKTERAPESDAAVAAAWSDFHSTFRPIIRRLAQRENSYSGIDADDAEAAAWLRIVERISLIQSISNIDSIHGWIREVARREMVDLRRANICYQNKVIMYLNDFGRRDSGTAKSMECEESETQAERRREIDRIVGTLSEMERQVLLLGLEEGMTDQRIAEAITRTAAQVRVIRHRALAKLRNWFAGGHQGGGGRD